MRLEAGRFYKAKDGEIWCCWRVRENAFAEEHASADCIRVADGRTEYFYADGRYDGHGLREHCLIEEVPRRPTAPTDETVAWLLDRFEDIAEDADALLKQAPEVLHPAILGIKCVAENQLGLRDKHGSPRRESPTPEPEKRGVDWRAVAEFAVRADDKISREQAAERVRHAREFERKQTLEACARVALSHEEWANDPGRLTEDERRLIVGACQVIANEIRAIGDGPLPSTSDCASPCGSDPPLAGGEKCALPKGHDGVHQSGFGAMTQSWTSAASPTPSSGAESEQTAPPHPDSVEASIGTSLGFMLDARNRIEDAGEDNEDNYLYADIICAISHLRVVRDRYRAELRTAKAQVKP